MENKQNWSGIMSRNREEIKKTAGIFIKIEGADGFGGTYFPTYFKNGKLKIDNDMNNALHFIFSNGCGWEHLSVSTPVKTPTWEQMAKMKEIFFKDDEVCFQLHPKKDDYVNMHEHCLHIWKPINVEIPTPPSVMVGIRKGHEKQDIEEIKRLANELPDWGQR